jgi:serine/threonine-protein kinase HipA
MNLRVYISNKLVGMISDSSGEIVFAYDESWLTDGFAISPIQLPLQDRVFTFPEIRRKDAFKGLPGIFADSLPDKFGNIIIENYLAKKGISINSITQLQKLSYIGHRGMGSLVYKPEQRTKESRTALKMRELVESARKVLQGSIDAKAAEIISIGASAGGARAKAVIAWNQETNEIRPGNINAPAGFEYWIIKFDGAGDSLKGWPLVEKSYFEMAVDAKIGCPNFLIKSDAEKNHHFLIKRFDRTDQGEKILIHSLGGLLHHDFNDQGELGYLDFMNVARQLGCAQQDIDQIFRRAAFNVLTCNQDDHSKNFSFIYHNDNWTLSPAYDLCFAMGGWCDGHQLHVVGKRTGITKKDLLQLAKLAAVKQPNKIIDEVLAVATNAREYFIKNRVPQGLLKKYQILNEIDRAVKI